MRVEFQNRGAVVVITVTALRVDSAVIAQFVQTAGTALDGARRAVLDLSGVPFLDSTALGALVGLRKRLGAEGGIAIAGAQPAVRNLFRLTRLDTVFPLFATVADAVAASETA
ncbi:MAG: STAS domain-containing protein [Deltaproteobacteria bacterium]|nr:STAS domain-containing protein [Deltaproteobacteria bacterium]